MLIYLWLGAHTIVLILGYLIMVVLVRATNELLDGELAKYVTNKRIVKAPAKRGVLKKSVIKQAVKEVSAKRKEQ